MVLRSPLTLLFALLFFVFSAAILGDTAAEALLLANFPAGVLPNMYLVNSLFLFLMSMVLISLIDRLNRGRFFIGLLITHFVCILAIRVLSTTTFSLLYPLLFSYSYVMKILTFMLFWTIANDICDARAAKETFPKIAAGGVLGGLLISFCIGFLARHIGPSNLLLVWAGLTGLSIVLFLPLYRLCAKDLRKKPAAGIQKKGIALRSDLRLILREPLLRNMSLLYFLIFFLLLNQDFQFYAILRETFLKVPSPESMATRLSSFLGLFRGVSTSITFLLQMTVAGFFLTRLGTARSMYLMPATFALIFVALLLQTAGNFIPLGAMGNMGSPFFYPLFGLIVAGVGLRIAMFDSIFSPNFQIFFSSLPKEIRGRGKIFIEGAIKPLAISSAGLFMMFGASRLPRPVVFSMLAAVAVLLLILTARLRSCYTDSIARALGGLKSKRLSSILNIDAQTAGESLLAVLSRALRNPEREVRLFAVEMLRRLNTGEAVAVLKEEFEKTVGPERAAVTASLAGIAEPDLIPLFEKALLDTDPLVVASAVLALSRLGTPDAVRLIQPYLFHENNRVRANAAIGLWPAADKVTREKLFKALKRMAESANPLDVECTLDAMGEIGEVTLLPVFKQIHGGLPSAGRTVYLHWLSGLGKIPHPDALDLLMQSLSIASRRDLFAARRALTGLALRFPGQFTTYLDRDNWRVRRNALEIIQDTDLKTQPAVVDAVRRLGWELVSDTHRLQDAIAALLVRQHGPEAAFLVEVLREEWIEPAKDCLILIASVLDATGKINLVGPRLRHTDPHIRANAIEALENLGDPALNRFLIPLFERKMTRVAALPPGKLLPQIPADIFALLKRLLEVPSEWLRICCTYTCYRFYLKKNDPAFLRLIGLQSPVSQETLRTILASRT